MEREREAAALRREIEMKVRMAFGAVNEEEDDDEDGGMLNGGDDEEAGDGQRKASRKRASTKRTSNTTNASVIREEEGGERDVDMDEEDAIRVGDGATFGEQQQQQEEQNAKPKKLATITTMFKRFADRNNGRCSYSPRPRTTNPSSIPPTVNLTTKC